MQNPANFSKYNPNTLRLARYFLQKHQDAFGWKENEAVLEVGCANGSISTEVLYPFLKNHLNNLLAVDICESAIEEAKAKNKNRKIIFEEMNFGDENQGDLYVERFDKIFSFCCLHLVKPDGVWVKNVFKMLKTGGQVFGTVIQSPNLISEVMDEQLAEQSAPWSFYIQNKPNALSFYGPNPTQTMVNILSEAGLIVDVVAREYVKNSFENKQMIIKTLRTISFFVQYIPENMKEDYLADFLRRIFERLEINEKGYHYPLEIISFVATKK